MHRRRAGDRGRRGCGRLKKARLDWTERILQFPVRAAAVDDFLRDLRARGSADLNGVLATLNEGSLCRQAQDYWVRQGWIIVSPSTPLHAIVGPNFDRELSLRRFCGEQRVERMEAVEPPPESEESQIDDDS